MLITEITSDEKEGVIWLREARNLSAVIHSEKTAVLLRGEAIKEWMDSATLRIQDGSGRGIRRRSGDADPEKSLQGSAGSGRRPQCSHWWRKTEGRSERRSWHERLKWGRRGVNHLV